MIDRLRGQLLRKRHVRQFFHFEDQKADLDGMHDKYTEETRAFETTITKGTKSRGGKRRLRIILLSR